MGSAPASFIVSTVFPELLTLLSATRKNFQMGPTLLFLGKGCESRSRTNPTFTITTNPHQMFSNTHPHNISRPSRHPTIRVPKRFKNGTVILPFIEFIS
jgi:hypothetical protein